MSPHRTHHTSTTLLCLRLNPTAHTPSPSPTSPPPMILPTRTLSTSSQNPSPQCTSHNRSQSPTSIKHPLPDHSSLTSVPPTSPPRRSIRSHVAGTFISILWSILKESKSCVMEPGWYIVLGTIHDLYITIVTVCVTRQWCLECLPQHPNRDP